MTNRRLAVLALAALSVGVLLAPARASAQSVWDVLRDRIEDRNQRRNDDYYGRRRGGNISDSERRVLRNVARRIDSRSRDFQRNVDRLLDDSRYDDSRREDDINQLVRSFRSAADRFRDRAGDSNDLSRSENEARQLLEAASVINRNIRRVRLDGRTASDWSQIRNDLRTVADIYGFRFRDDDYDGSYGNDDWRRGRQRDDEDWRRDRQRTNDRRWPY
jgi:hypothetical protein